MQCHYEIEGRFRPSSRKAAATARSIARLKRSSVSVYKVCGGKKRRVMMCNRHRCIKKGRHF